MRAGELVGVQEMSGARRGLYEGEQERPGRSELTYMQHKYTPLDTRIIIITAAIFLLLLSILFLNFFIRWALRRFFLLHSQKPINTNKGLSKRQVQALPSFTYSSSKPPIFAASYPSPQFYNPFTSCHGGDNFDHTLKPISSHSCCHDLLPTKIGSTQVDDLPTKIGSPQVEDEFHHHPPTKSKIHDLDHSLPSQLGSSTKVDEVIYESPSKFGSLEAHGVREGNNPPMKGDEVANDANSIIGSTKDDVLTIDSEAKATFKGGNPIIGCRKADGVSNNGEDNASTPTPCPICLVDYVDGDTIRVLPTCRHYFHVGCIDMWLSKSSSCPACRANILEATRIPINQKPTLQLQVIITTSSH